MTISRAFKMLSEMMAQYDFVSVTATRDPKTGVVLVEGFQQTITSASFEFKTRLSVSK